jgi:hypothetical protein
MVTSSGMYPFMRLRSGGHDTVPATRMMRLGLTTVSSVLRLAAMALLHGLPRLHVAHGFIEPPVCMAAQVWHGAGAHAHGELGPAKAVTLRMLSLLSASAKQ